MTTTRKVTTTIAGAIAGITLALMPAALAADPSESIPEPETSTVADLNNNEISSDFPWN